MSGDLIGQMEEKSLKVECGQDSGRTYLQILELQPAGKKKMSTVEFLRGYPILPGYRFGPEQLS